MNQYLSFAPGFTVVETGFKPRRIIDIWCKIQIKYGKR